VPLNVAVSCWPIAEPARSSTATARSTTYK
jgi:hypothetical protein